MPFRVLAAVLVIAGVTVIVGAPVTPPLTIGAHKAYTAVLPRWGSYSADVGQSNVGTEQRYGSPYTHHHVSAI
jgi:hypothetical protein